MSNSNNKYKTLVSNTMLISLGTFGSKLLVFFMVRFYTSYLTPADYGTADLITQTANLLFPLISLGITDGVFRFAVEFVRMPDVQLGYLAFGWLTMGQLLCLPLIAVGLWLLCRQAPIMQPDIRVELNRPDGPNSGRDSGSNSGPNSGKGKSSKGGKSRPKK